MVEYYYGDIFDAPIDILIHQANCFNTMGAGIALEIKRRFPEVYEADCKTVRGDKNKLGTFTFANINRAKQGVRILRVYNLYGQYHYAGSAEVRTEYKAFEDGLNKIKDNLIGFSDFVIGIPYRIGCGLAGGNWVTVESIINKVFKNYEDKILICRKD